MALIAQGTSRGSATDLISVFPRPSLYLSGFVGKNIRKRKFRHYKV